MKQFFISIAKIISVPLALLYGAIVWLRNKLYDINFFSSTSFSLPVISVGNLSVGGTGKTPHVEYIINLLKDKFYSATLSRGYKRHTRGFILANEQSTAKDIGDEPFQYKQKFHAIEVAVAEDRMTAIPELVQRIPFLQTIVLDDAFQHRTVKPGLNILITDYNKRFTKDYILPFGTLRESRDSYQRADIIIVSKCPTEIQENEKKIIIDEIKPTAKQKIFFSSIYYSTLLSYETNYSTEENFKNTSVLLVTGIANPTSLFTYITKQFAEVFSLQYNDHYYFKNNDIDEIKSAFDNIKNKHKIIITTEKDYARLLLLKDKIDEYQLPIFIQTIETNFLFHEQEKFDTCILDFVNPYYPIIPQEPSIEDF